METVYKIIKNKTSVETLNHSLKTLMNLKETNYFKEFSAYKPNQRHSFMVFLHISTKKEIDHHISQGYVPTESILEFYHCIDNQDYDNIKFYKMNGEINLEYEMEERAIENLMSRKNYPEEWEIFSNMMPWEWIYDQFKLLSVQWI